MPESERLKAEGLQFGNGRGFKGYGIIFQPTAFEQEQMLEEHALIIAEQITNAMNKQ